MDNIKAELKELRELISDIRWTQFGLIEKIDNHEKNINIEIRDRIMAVESILNKAMGGDNFYQRINNNDTMSEKEKYTSLYSGELSEWYKNNTQEGRFKEYGCENHGSGIIKYLQQRNTSSLLDVGCGIGLFCVECRAFIKKVYGLDIASVKAGKVIEADKIEYLDADITNIPLKDNQVEYATGFDILEHVPEHLIDKGLNELNRVSSKGMIFSISSDKCNYRGEIFHKTIQPREWWMDKLKKYGQVQLHGQTPYVDNKYIIVYKGE